MELSSPQLHEALGQTVRGSSKARFGGLPEDAEHVRHAMQCTHPAVHFHLVEEISTLGIEEPLGEVVPQTAQQMNAGAV